MEEVDEGNCFCPEASRPYPEEKTTPLRDYRDVDKSEP
jgi:hypothetical protein